MISIGMALEGGGALPPLQSEWGGTCPWCPPPMIIVWYCIGLTLSWYIYTLFLQYYTVKKKVCRTHQIRCATAVPASTPISVCNSHQLNRCAVHTVVSVLCTPH